MKEYAWHGYTVRITKKKVKHTNVRIKPAEPELIHMSVPFSISYEAALRMLEQPEMLRWVEKHRNQRTEPGIVPRMREEERKKNISNYQKRLQDALPDMFRKWELILGVRSRQITIRNTKSQWGSCNPRTGNISISVWLGAFPDACIEYVVIHELAHLLERGHNERFYKILDQHYPIWRQCRKQLKNGNNEEAVLIREPERS